MASRLLVGLEQADGAFRQHPYSFAVSSESAVLSERGPQTPPAAQRPKVYQASQQPALRGNDRHRAVAAGRLSPGLVSDDTFNESAHDRWDDVPIAREAATPTPTVTPASIPRATDAALHNAGILPQTATLSSAPEQRTLPEADDAPAVATLNGESSLQCADQDEVAFLLRYFADVLAPNMDAFSADQHYRRTALRLARTNSLVCYSACAAAAKQLGHIREPHRTTCELAISHPFVRATSRGKPDFLWYGAKYYGMAIQAMAAELSIEASATFGLSPEGLPWNHHVSPTSSRGSPSGDQPRFIAAAIMCYYEQLSASIRAWGRHLDGMFRLLQLDEVGHPSTGMTVEQGRQPFWQTLPDGVLKRALWHFAHSDSEQSFISEKPPRLVACDVSVWNALNCSEDLASDILAEQAASDRVTGSTEVCTKALETVLRCYARVISLQHTKVREDPNAHELLGTAWDDLERSLGAWDASYSCSVSPDTVQPAKTISSSIPERWFVDDASAIAWTYYRMCRILVLVNRPESPTHVPRHRWMASYRAICGRMAEYARDIISANLARPTSAVRWRMLQPLYVAGQCLWQESEQRLVVTLLRGLEHDLGLASSYRIQALLREWGTPHLLERSDLDEELHDLSS